MKTCYDQKHVPQTAVEESDRCVFRGDSAGAVEWLAHEHIASEEEPK